MVDLGIPGYDDAEQIGRGGFATVYRARRRLFGDWVAIKLIDNVPDDRTLRRVDRELLAVGRVAGHRNVVTVHVAGRRDSDGRPYIVMELVPGGTLAERVRSGGPLPWAEVVEIGIVLGAAVQWAHDRGVIHRDLKPENVLVDDRFSETRDRIRLSDFGIASIEGRSVTHAFSAAHAAPEVILDGAAPSTKADLYGLASTLYELLNGEAPFVREDDQGLAQIFARIRQGIIPDLRPKGVPDPVAAVIERGLQSDPDQRPESAAEFATMLGAAAAEVAHAAQSPLPSVEIVDDRSGNGHDPMPPPPDKGGQPSVVRQLVGRRRFLFIATGAVVAGTIAVRSFLLADADPNAAVSSPTSTSTSTSTSTTSLETSVPSTPPSSSPPSGDLTTFSDAETGITVDYPAAWRRVQVADYRLAVDAGNKVAFTIRVLPIQTPATTANLQNFKAVTDGLVNANSSVKVLKEQAISLNGMLGYYYFYTFTDGAVQAVHAHYFLFSGNKMNVLVFQSLPDAFEGVAVTFDKVAESFRSDPNATAPPPRSSTTTP